jgi:hypothetical protein
VKFEAEASTPKCFEPFLLCTAVRSHKLILLKEVRTICTACRLNVIIDLYTNNVNLHFDGKPGVYKVLGRTHQDRFCPWANVMEDKMKPISFLWHPPFRNTVISFFWGPDKSSDGHRASRRT